MSRWKHYSRKPVIWGRIPVLRRLYSWYLIRRMTKAFEESGLQKPLDPADGVEVRVKCYICGEEESYYIYFGKFVRDSVVCLNCGHSGIVEFEPKRGR